MPQLTTLLKTLEGLPEGLAQYYEPVDANDEGAGYTLSLDKSATKTGIGEFRAENVLLRKQVEGFEAKLDALGGLQGKLDALVSAAGSAEDKKNIEEGNIEAVVARQVEANNLLSEKKYGALESSFSKVQKERDGLLSQVGETRVRDAMLGAFVAGKARMKEGAEVDLLSRATSVWSIDAETNALVAKNAQTNEPLYGAEGKPLEMAEWATNTAASASYFFESSQGGGAGGSRGSDGSRKLGEPREVDVHDGSAMVKNLDAIIAGKMKPVMEA